MTILELVNNLVMILGIGFVAMLVVNAIGHVSGEEHRKTMELSDKLLDKTLDKMAKMMKDMFRELKTLDEKPSKEDK